DWQPQGWRIIFIGPTATWREEWGTWEAIREIVQNSLDEGEAYDYGQDEFGLFISDKGRGIAVSSFLLGPAKLKEKWARGKYGEGMKIGALALLREGYPVYVQSGDRELHIIFLEQEADAKVMSLAALWRPLASPIKGTTWHIIGYRGSDYHENFAVNLPKKAILNENISMIREPVQRKNQIIDIKYTDNQSKIYVRDIFMKDIKGQYSYNLWSFDLAPDRFAPKNESDMWVDIGRAWSNVTNIDMLETFLKMVGDYPIIDSEERNIQMYGMGYKAPHLSGESYQDDIGNNKIYWQKAWNNVFGEDAVLRTTDRWDATVKHLGYKSISMSWYVKSALAQAIKTDEKLIEESQDKLREVAIIEDNKLTASQRASLNLVRRIAEDVARSGVDKRKVHAAVIPPASERVRTAGLYSTKTMDIYISTDQLDRGSSAVDTFIHEVAHHNSGAEDGDRSHYEAISSIAGDVVRLTAQGNYDDLLKNTDFVW
ncbi:MAG: hypothetical protein PHI12_14410, partial [Dehalococcoidales bacterium]|nr:hypothetical protein [Dehalococcoidales bacterium]